MLHATKKKLLQHSHHVQPESETQVHTYAQLYIVVYYCVPTCYMSVIPDWLACYVTKFASHDFKLPRILSLLPAWHRWCELAAASSAARQSLCQLLFDLQPGRFGAVQGVCRQFQGITWNNRLLHEVVCLDALSIHLCCSTKDIVLKVVLA